MRKQVHLAVFDCDGTLVDSQRAIISCMHAAFQREGLPRPDEDKIRRIVGLPLHVGIANLHPRATDPTISNLKEGYSKAWMELRNSSGLEEPLYPNAIETLDQLTMRGWELGIATGKSHRGLIHTLNNHDVLNRFSTLQTADRVLGKPHPEMLINAMKDVGATPASTVMIGDTTFDMEMAKNAGVLAIGVAWGYHADEELTKSGAHIVIHTYSDLPDILDSLG